MIKNGAGKMPNTAKTTSSDKWLQAYLERQEKRDEEKAKQEEERRKFEEERRKFEEERRKFEEERRKLEDERYKLDQETRKAEMDSLREIVTALANGRNTGSAIETTARVSKAPNAARPKLLD